MCFLGKHKDMYSLGASMCIGCDLCMSMQTMHAQLGTGYELVIRGLETPAWWLPCPGSAMRYKESC